MMICLCLLCVCCLLFPPLPFLTLQQLARKELGHSETYPQSIMYSPNGRLCSVLGDGEFTVYVVGSTWRHLAFGDASEFVWGRGKVCDGIVQMERVRV
jgi:hypothetical protein